MHSLDRENVSHKSVHRDTDTNRHTNHRDASVVTSTHDTLTITSNNPTLFTACILSVHPPFILERTITAFITIIIMITIIMMIIKPICVLLTLLLSHLYSLGHLAHIHSTGPLLRSDHRHSLLDSPDQVNDLLSCHSDCVSRKTLQERCRCLACTKLILFVTSL